MLGPLAIYPEDQQPTTSQTPVPEIQHPLLAPSSTRHKHGTQIKMQAKHSHTQNKILKENENWMLFRKI